jgi:hypothetical protein
MPDEVIAALAAPDRYGGGARALPLFSYAVLRLE